jgi:hypothetical protein
LAWTLDLLGCRPSLSLGPVKEDSVLLDIGAVQQRLRFWAR